jgi:hypothetical protein
VRWDKAQYELPIFEEASGTLKVLTDLMGTLENLSTTSTSLMRIVSTFRTEFDVKSLAIQAAIDAVSASLQDFLQPAMGHVLVVPPIPPFERKSAAPVIPARGFGDAAYGLLLDKTGLPDLLGDGGNYGLYRKFVESLFDAGDYSRPMFSNDAYVAGGILLIGAPNYLSVLRDVLNLSRFFGVSFPTPMDQYRMPVPQNVKARPIAVPRARSIGDEEVLSLAGIPVPQGATVRTLIMQRPSPPGEYAVRLFWDPTPVVKFDLSFSASGPVSYRIVSTHIFVSRSVRIKNSDDLSLREVKRIDVPGGVARIPIAGAVSASTPLHSIIVHGFDPSDDYYFSVGFSVEITMGSDTAVFPPTFATLSNQVRVNLRQQAPYKKFVEGRVPDWIAINNPLSFAPGVQDLIAKIQAVIDAVSSTYAGYRNEAASLLESTENAIRAIRDQLDELLDLLGSLESMLAGLLTSDIGAYATVFAGQGGVPYMMRTVGDLLLNKSVENRPPFDRGDESVAALIFVAGSETAAGVSSFRAALELLLGPADSSGFSVIESINRVSSTAALTGDSGIDIEQNNSESDVSVRALGIDGPANDPC